MNVLTLNLFFINFLILSVIKNEGFPNLSFIIVISLKFNPLVKPVPRDFTSASFAANFFAKKDVLFLIFFEFIISFFEKTLFINRLFLIAFVILEFSTIYTCAANFHKLIIG